MLPELLPGAFEPVGGRLFEGIEELVEGDVWGLVDEEVDVLGHEDVDVDAGLVAGTGLFEDSFDDRFGLRGEVGEPVEATEGDEVEGLGLLESF